MNLLEFLLENTINYILIVFPLFITIFTYKGWWGLKLKSFTSYLLISSIVGCLISFFISYNLNLGRYTLYFFYSTTLLLFIQKLIKNEKSFLVFLKGHVEDLLYLTLIFLFISIYVFYNVEYKFYYDGHFPYQYGIPFEILEGDYFSRIKIWDNYPLIWSKFHFLTGSVNSILICFAPFKNIFLFKMYQLIVAYLVMKSILENLSRNKIKYFNIISLVSIVCIIWLFNTNGALSIAYFFISLIFYTQRKYDKSFIFLVLFSVVVSRNLLLGISILSLVCFFHYKKINFIKLSPYLIFPILNVYSMIFSGDSPLSLNFVQIFNTSSLSSFSYLPGKRWTYLFYQHDLTELLYHLKNYSYPQIHLFLKLVSLGFIFILIIRLRNRFYLIIPVLLSLIIFSIVEIKNESFLSTSDYSSITQFFIIVEILILFFLLPLLIIYQSSLKREMKIILYFMNFSCILNNLVFGPSLGIPTYFFINTTLFLIIIRKTDLNVNKHLILILVLLSVLLPKTNYDTHLNFKSFDVDEFDDSEFLTMKYSDFKDLKKTIFFSNIYGKRIYHKHNNPRLHISDQFALEKHNIKNND